MKNKKIFFFELIFLVFLSVFFVQLVSADTISVNGGGTGQVVVNPGGFIEQFFFGEPYEAECGNGILDAGEQCDDGNTASGDGCSSTCTTETEDEGGTTGGGGGGGGGAVVSSPITVSPTEFNINMKVSTNVQRTISVTNTGSSSYTAYVSQSGLDGMVIFDQDSIQLAAGETKTLTVTFVAPAQEDIYTGTITVGGKPVSVSLNVKTQLLLFDSNIIVLNDNYEVPQGSDLKTQVTLIPLGDKERLDVTLNYVIKDYSGKVYLTKSETLLVEEQVNFKRDFDTGSLPLGKYIVGLELVYPNGVAPSSAHFEVVEPLPFDIVGRIMFYLIILILLVLILILIILIIRYLKKRREERGA